VQSIDKIAGFSLAEVNVFWS